MDASLRWHDGWLPVGDRRAPAAPVIPAQAGIHATSRPGTPLESIAHPIDGCQPSLA
jgi:hypothetical protein